MAWIESHQELADHPKTLKMARILGLSIPAAIGHLHCLWWWASDYAQDGELARFDSIDLALGAKWDGDADEFLNALTTVGFLDRAESSLVIHDWRDYAGKLIDRRKANAERMRAVRAQNESSTNDERAKHVQRTNNARDEHVHACVELQNSTEPNNTEPNVNSRSSAVPKTPKTRYTDGFELFWSAYPRKDDKKGAAVVWNRIRPSPDLLSKMLKAIDKQGLALKEPQFQPMPSTWLNRERWNDQSGPPQMNGAAPKTITDRENIDPYGSWGKPK